MLLTISTSHKPAADLGYLLHKNPARVQTEYLSFGTGHVFYPEASSERCTAALLVEIDPVALVRCRGPAGEGSQLEQYVNDRPYSANSFLSVVMSRIFMTSMSGRSEERQQLADTAIPVTANLPVIAAMGGEDMGRRLFEPLGYHCCSSIRRRPTHTCPPCALRSKYGGSACTGVCLIAFESTGTFTGEHTRRWLVCFR